MKLNFGDHGDEVFNIFSEAPEERERAREAGGFTGGVDFSEVWGNDEIVYRVYLEGEVWEYFGPGKGEGISR